MSQKGKRPRVEKSIGIPPVDRRPKARRLRGVHGDEHPAWRLSLVDLEGPWAWSLLEGATLLDVLRLAREMERATWTEIRQMMTGGGRRRGALHKFIPVENLCREAQDRLVEIELDDFDQLFRFRLGNLKRLWGVIEGDVFYPVWWDPRHEVCPSNDPD